MSLTLSQGDGITVITVTSNPQSKWPILCQVLGTVCYSPVCSVSQGLKGKLTGTLKVLGTLQIIVGIINIVLGTFFASLYIFNDIMETKAPFWLGGMFLAVGIVSILAAKFPSSCVLAITVILNVISAGLAITAVVLYSVDLGMGNNMYCQEYYYYSRYESATSSPEVMENREKCLRFKRINQMILGGLDIMMIVLSVLQLCVTVSFCVLTMKALCKKSGDAKSVDDPQLHKPLLEDAAVNPAR